MSEGHSLSTAYSNQPVILLVGSIGAHGARVLKRRLTSLFEVSADSVVVSGVDGLYAFYLRGSYVPSFTAEIYRDSNSFTAAAAPVLEPEVVEDDTGIALKKFVRAAFHGESGRDSFQAPMAVYQADFAEGRAWALNDSFGLGRVYVSRDPSRPAMSNNIAAVSLTQNTTSEADLRYWESYYTSGGPVGDLSYVQGVSRVPGGSTVILDAESIRVKSTHSLEGVLLEARERPSDYSRPISAATKLMASARPFFNEKLSIGLSGGRDSRLVTALALKAGLDFQSFTAIPPELEADIARELNRLSSTPFRWEARDSRVGVAPANPAKGKVATLPSILERAKAWFEFTGGDNWSTYARRAPMRRTPIKLGAMALSGAFGDFTRGHYYTEAEALRNDPSPAIERYHRSFLNSRRIIPAEVRERGAAQLRETFDEMGEAGISGFQSLEFSFLVNRMRRQLPHPAPNTLLPLLTSEMVSEVFWNEPVGKLHAQGLRDMTDDLMPEWSDVPYFHEAAVGTDPNVTNKVTIQPTYWEVDREDFLQSVEYSLDVNDFVSIGMDAVRAEISELPEGRNRTNATFEFIFWHAGATALLSRINSAKAEGFLA